MPADTRPRVLQVVTHLDLGGAEQVALSLVEGLAERVDSQLFAVLGAGQGTVADAMAARLAAAGCRWHAGTRLPFKRGGLLAAGMALARLIARDRPDIVHLHTELPETCWAVASCVSGRVRATPVLRTIHNTQLWPAWGAIGRWTERRLGDRHAVAVSQGALAGLEAFRRTAGLVPPAQGAGVLYNGVAPPARLAPASPRAPVRVLFAGRLEAQKGADLLPAIWSAARAQTGRGAQLTILGDGSLRAVLESAARADPTITVAPPVSRLADLLADYDVLLMPSRFEGLGLVAVEGILAGLGFVGFDAPGLREVVPATHPTLPAVGDINGLAALLAVAIDNPDNVRSPGTVAQVGDRFAMERMLDGYASLYRTLGFIRKKMNTTAIQNSRP
jgi:glycosyltransferase involved in cell wall biosynthesis